MWHTYIFVYFFFFQRIGSYIGGCIQRFMMMGVIFVVVLDSLIHPVADFDQQHTAKILLLQL